MKELVRTAQAYVTGDFSDSTLIWNSFLYHVASMPGVTILGTLRHDFPYGGFSGLVLLGESHAAIHTWPEHNTAWIELATCGDPSALALWGSWKTPPTRKEEGGEALGWEAVYQNDI